MFTGFQGAEARLVSRLRSLCRINQVGLYFGKEKMEALYRGDTSSAVIHRYYIYGFQGTGIHLYEAPEGTPALALLHARYAQMAFESLAEIHVTGNHRLEVQAIILLIHAFIFSGFTANAQLYLLKICEIIDKAKLRFLPVYGRPPRLSEQVREDAAVLSQAIYLDNYFRLTLSGSTSVTTGEVEKEFRLDLQVRIVGSFLVAKLEADTAARSSECTHSCSIYVR